MAFWVTSFLLAAGPFALLGAGQVLSTGQQPTPGMPSNAHDPRMGDAVDPNMSRRLEHEREHLADDERRKRITADTQKLLELATELKADVDKAGKNELSLAVINKAAEIEKLSRDVKERMKN